VHEASSACYPDACSCWPYNLEDHRVSSQVTIYTSKLDAFF